MSIPHAVPTNVNTAMQLPENCALFIADGLSMSGRIELKDERPVVIAGQFDGEIDIAGELIIEASGRIGMGPVRTGSLTLHGQMRDVTLTEVTDLLDVRAGGLLQGERVRYNELVLARGAQINAALEASSPHSAGVNSVVVRPFEASGIDARTTPVLTEVGASSQASDAIMRLGVVAEPSDPFAIHDDHDDHDEPFQRMGGMVDGMR